MPIPVYNVWHISQEFRFSGMTVPCEMGNVYKDLTSKYEGNKLEGLQLNGS
jgi:hypothetical protein